MEKFTERTKQLLLLVYQKDLSTKCFMEHNHFSPLPISSVNLKLTDVVVEFLFAYSHRQFGVLFRFTPNMDHKARIISQNKEI
ncbi:hypothetical protein T4A_6394 [Trichinella pseudospiralis]|uniref:Uncharacterized protein n=1 Tax=Trichinella pseudospiralis TaxID=6337 RepID=A0A0V1EAA9_TRIPS|nr:hypothetical protein T4A_6394 [Trichinella pseudospiralis]